MRTTSSIAQLCCPLVLVLAAIGCQPATETGESHTKETNDESHGAKTDVAWFEGSPDEAFALAATEGKPVFLYWGAEWCPPCHYLKDKVFKEPDFIERSKEFITVYLDGDTASAQALGEQLDVKGFPTVIVFSAAGDEVMRMPSDVPVARYADLMDRALRLDRPVEEILAQVLENGPANADVGDLDLLAYYSWGQDSRVALADSERVEVFRQLWSETPRTAASAQARFLTYYTGAVIGAARQSDRPASDRLTKPERETLTDDYLALLGSPQLRNDNLSEVAYAGPSAINLLQPEAGDGRAQLVAAWDSALEQCEDDDELTVDDRLTATFARSELARLDLPADAPAPAEVIEGVRTKIAWALESVSGSSELQAVLGTAAHALEEVGLEEESQQLIAEKMGDTYAPYYFQSWLADLKASAGETGEALELFRAAWDSSNGRYSRFRWGTTYVRQLMKLAPDGHAQIAEGSEKLLNELLTHDDAFALGNRLRLGQLEAAYVAWANEHTGEDVLSRIKSQVQAACTNYPSDGEDSQQQRCLAFLSEAA